MYFVLKIYRMIEYNVIYIIICFQNFLRCLDLKFLTFREDKKWAASMAPELH
jgi:hypothetical protein